MSSSLCFFGRQKVLRTTREVSKSLTQLLLIYITWRLHDASCISVWCESRVSSQFRKNDVFALVRKRDYTPSYGLGYDWSVRFRFKLFFLLSLEKCKLYRLEDRTLVVQTGNIGSNPIAVGSFSMVGENAGRHLLKTNCSGQSNDDPIRDSAKSR